MNRSLLAPALVFAIAAAHVPVAAAVFERDWKTPGDGLLTFDDVNRREWLDLPLTILSSQIPGDGREERYQYVVSQTAPGGMFAGFTVAKSADVIALAESAGIVPGPEIPQNVGPVSVLGELLGYTVPNQGQAYIGLLDEVGAPPKAFRFGALFVVQTAVQPAGRAGYRITNDDQSLVLPPPAVFLYRAIPEPSSLWLSFFSVAGLAHKWRRSKGGHSRLAKFSGRSHQIERLERRRVLSSSADIVFLVDESGSANPQMNGSNMWTWLKDTVFASSLGGPIRRGT